MIIHQSTENTSSSRVFPLARTIKCNMFSYLIGFTEGEITFVLQFDRGGTYIQKENVCLVVIVLQ